MSLHSHACLVCGKESKLLEPALLGNTHFSLCYCEAHRIPVQELIGLARIGVAALVAVQQEGQRKLAADQLHLVADKSLRMFHE